MRTKYKLVLSCLFSLLLLALPIANASAEKIELTDEDIATYNKDEANIVSPCLDIYRKARNKYATISGIEPFVGIAGLAESAALAFGWEYSGWFALKAALGPLAPATGVVLNQILPATILVGAVTYEAVVIARFRKSSQIYRLMKDVYGIGDDKMLNELTSQVQNYRPEITQEMIQNKILAADQSKAICDGSWVTTTRVFSGKNSLAKKLAFMKDISKHIISE